MWIILKGSAKGNKKCLRSFPGFAGLKTSTKQVAESRIMDGIVSDE